jgi:dihydroorotase
MQHDLVVAGKVVGPSGVRYAEVGIDEGRISEVRRQGLAGSRRIEAGRCLIFPGFVDAHVHLREPGWERKEDFRTGTEAAVHGGVTTVADMPNNPKPATTAIALREKARLAGRKALIDVRFFAGVTEKSLGDAPETARLACGYKLYLARSTGNLTFPPQMLEKAFRVIAGTGKPASIHCEDQGIIDARSEALAGDKRADAYCDMRPPAAEVSAVRKVVAALRRTPSLRANVCHASTAGTLSLVRGSKAAGLHLECEAALHHLYFRRQEMLTNRMLRTNPPLRGEGDREALLAALADGTVSFLVTDHAPHLPKEKTDEGASGVPGLDDFGHVVSWLLADGGIPPATVAVVASSGPAAFLGLADRGAVAAGKRADLTILDIRSPEVVRAEDVKSKCGWSPYEGREFPGRIRWTVSAGEVLLDDYELVS